MSALVVGLSSLVTVDKGVKEQVFKVANKGGGGVSRLSMYGPGELEFEALMRMLDYQASGCIKEMSNCLVINYVYTR